MWKFKEATGHGNVAGRHRITKHWVRPVSRRRLDYWIGGVILAILFVLGLALPMI